jgi:NADH-quinone oxidoreductase subunit N
VDANLVNALTGYLPLVVAEAILGVAACVLFLGGAFKGGRNLWGVVALVSLGLSGVGLWWTAATVPSVDGLRDEVNERLQKLQEAHDGAEQAHQRVLRATNREQRVAADAEEASLRAEETSLRKDLEAMRTRLEAQAYATYASPLRHDRFALVVKLLALAGGVVLVLLSWPDAPDAYAGEFHGSLLLLVAGTMLAAAANDLITLFLALELVSIPTYVMLYLPRTDASAQEAAVKYFLLSLLSSALLLFGFSYLYGLTGTTNLPALSETITGGFTDKALPRVALVAILMVVAGLGFRITAVPFHFYAPDVYQGTATSLAAMLTYIPKVVGFAALLRLLAPLSVGDQVPLLLFIMAAVTMTLGNVLALLQDNLKRMLAYSGVAHAGYMLIGLAVAPRLPRDAVTLLGGYESVLFYLIAYGSMTIGAFAILSYLSSPKKQVETINDLAGLGRTHPGTALLMVLFLFSLIGMPLTAGFWGKAFLFSGALSVRDDPNHLYLWLAVIGAINAAIGAWYYLRVATVMYLRETLRPLEKPQSWPVLMSIWLCALVTLGAGLFPNPVKEGVKAAVLPTASTAGADSRTLADAGP